MLSQEHVIVTLGLAVRGYEGNTGPGRWTVHADPATDTAAPCVRLVYDSASAEIASAERIWTHWGGLEILTRAGISVLEDGEGDVNCFIDNVVGHIPCASENSERP